MSLPHSESPPRRDPVRSVNRVFILGATRSGTSWVQRLAAEQSGVATVPELHLFERYVRPIVGAWDKETARLARVTAALRSGEPPSRRAIGLPTCLTEEEFEDVARGFLDAVTREVLSVYPDVELLIEKTPSNSLLVPLVHRLHPEAGYVHIVRDPTAVVRSLQSAARGWAKEWAPRSAFLGALAWRAHVAGARQARSLAGDGYLEVRYEDLRAGDSGTLEGLRAFLAVRAGAHGDSSTGDARLVVSGELRALLDGRPLPEPEEFGDGRTVHPPLSRFETLVIEMICGDLMDDLGYPRSRLSVVPGRLVVSAMRAVARRLSPSRRDGLSLRLQHRRPRSFL